METLRRDVEYALRTFRRQPGLVAAVLLALALGIGANTVIFSLMNAVLWNPLSLSAWHQPDRVAMLWEKNPALSFIFANRIPVRPQNYRAWREQEHSFSRLAPWSDQLLTLTDPDNNRHRPEQMETGFATADLFPLLGVQALIGRGFSVADMQHGKGTVAVLSNELYQSRFNSNPHVAGATIFVEGKPYTVIGVLPPGLAFPAIWGGEEQKKPQLWLPLDVHPETHADQASSLFVFGRLKDDVSLWAGPRRDANHRGTPGAYAARRGRLRHQHRNTARCQHRSFASPRCAGSADRGGIRAADRVRECRQSAAWARRGSRQRNGGPHGNRCKRLAPVPSDFDGEYVAEIALSLILVIGAGLMIRSLAVLMNTDLGFRVDHLLTMRITLPKNVYNSSAKLSAFNNRLIESVRNVSGIESAALTTALPMKSVSQSTFEIPGRPHDRNKLPVTDWARLSDGYFKTLRMRIIKGRTFTRQEALSTNPSVAVVNQAFADKFFPDTDPLGKQVTFGNEQGSNTSYSIIGVVANEHQMGPDNEQGSELYLPGQHLDDFLLVARTAGDPLKLANTVKQQVWNIDKDQPVKEAMTEEAALHEWSAPRRFNLTVLLVFAGIALVLAAMGLYSVLAYTVTLRTREIGVRVAIGAEPKDVARYIMRGGLTLSLAGIGVGVCAALALTRYMSSLIYASAPSTR